MKAYGWICHACSAENAADAAHCSTCGFPPQATGQQIEAARNGEPVPPREDAPDSRPQPLHGKAFFLIVISGMVLGLGMIRFAGPVELNLIGLGILLLAFSALWIPEYVEKVRQRRKSAHVRARSFSLHRCSGDEMDIWIKVCVLLSDPMPDLDGAGPPVVGYYLNIGARVQGPQPKAFLQRLITDGTIDWSETEFREIDTSLLDRDLLNHVTLPDENGVWYRSGRIFFHADDSEDSG